MKFVLNDNTKKRIAAFLSVNAIIFLIIVSLTAPFWAGQRSNSGELVGNIRYVIDAKTALVEGQFPIRTSPTALDGYNYPEFNFYGNFPFTIAGVLLVLFPINALDAMVIELCFFLYCGAIAVFLFGKKISSNNYAALMGSVIFLTAPYFLTNIYDRFAYTETIAFCIIPVVLLFLYEILSNNSTVYFFLFVISLIMLIHTHNILTFYTFFFILIILLFFFPSVSTEIVPYLKIILGIACALCISSWYFIPQLILSPFLQLSFNATVVYYHSYLTNLGVLLAPRLISPRPISLPELGLQIGWPILIVFSLTVKSLFFHTPGKQETKNLTSITEQKFIKSLFVCTIIAFIFVWSPINFWNYLPHQFLIVQFPYRLINFIIILCAFCTTYAIQVTLSNFNVEKFLICLCLSILFICPYIPNTNPEPSNNVYVNTIENSYFGSPLTYQVTPQSFLDSTIFLGSLDGISGNNVVNGLYDDKWVGPDANFSVIIPSNKQDLYLHVVGTIPSHLKIQNPKLSCFVDDTLVFEKDVMNATFAEKIPLISSENSTQISRDFSLVQISLRMNKSIVPENDPRPISYHLTSLQINQKNTKFYSLSELTKTKEKNTATINIPEPGFLELPVKYYPNMIQVSDNDSQIEYYKSITNMVVVNVTPGTHNLRWKFVGSYFFNLISIISLLLFICSFVLYLGITHMRKK